MTYLKPKYFFDIVFSTFILILLFPIWTTILFILIIEHKGKPFFKQSRLGYKEKKFTIFKFKTMNDKKDHKGNLLSDSHRITSLGKFIRKTSLDEIPQLLNVLKGDMSLVGPRPLLVSYLKLYNNEQRRRHEVKPGITGWAQVNGRNAISWEQKFEYDVWYVDHQSFVLDFKILLMTVVKVFKSEGINQVGQATMQPFKGSEKKG